MGIGGYIDPGGPLLVLKSKFRVAKYDLKDVMGGPRYQAASYREMVTLSAKGPLR